MSKVVIVAFLVSCTSNMLECRQLNTDNYKWNAHSQCVEALPLLKRQYESAGYENVMGRCHLLLPGVRHRDIAGIS